MSKRKVIVLSADDDTFDSLQTYLKAHEIYYERHDALDHLLKASEDSHPVVIISSEYIESETGNIITNRIKAQNQSTYIIAYEHNNCINGLKSAISLGADDFVTLPTDFDLFSHKIAAHYKHVACLQMAYSKAITHSNLLIDPVSKQATLKNQKLELTQSEFNILYLLAKEPDVVFKMEHLFHTITGQKSLGDYNALMTHVSRLRKKMAKIDNKHHYILTVRNKGYKFNPFNN